MPRRRDRQAGLGPNLTGAARHGYRSGETEYDVVAELQSRFPHASLTQISQITRKEFVRQKAVDVLLTTNAGQFANVPRLVNCPPGRGKLRIGLSITVTNSETGITKQFGHTTEVSGQNRVGQMIDQAIRDAEAQAVANGYTPYGLTNRDRSTTEPHFELTYVDCI